MAHDRMTNDDLDRNMGRAGQEDELGGGQDFGRQTPGRNPDQQQSGQKGAGSGQQQGMDDEEDFGGGASKGRNPGQQQNR